jgi:hypothetical protein
MKAIKKAIENAERLLPGIPVREDEIDPRWQAIIKVGEYIQTEPKHVWLFISKWGSHPNEDIRSAVATCLLEHLLEYHFKEFFLLVKDACQKSKRFASTYNMCAQFGEAEHPESAKVFTELKNKLNE